MLNSFYGFTETKAEALRNIARAGTTISNNEPFSVVRATVGEADPVAYEEHLAVPRLLARLEQALFDLLHARGRDWPRLFIEAIPVNANLSSVWQSFVLWLLMDEENGVLKQARPRQADSIRAVAELYREGGQDAQRFRARAEKLHAGGWPERREAVREADDAEAAVARRWQNAKTTAGLAGNSRAGAPARAAACAAGEDIVGMLEAAADVYVSGKGKAAYAFSSLYKEQFAALAARKLLELLAASPVSAN